MPLKKKKKSDWAEAKTRCRLSMVEVQMAKELGIAPKSLIKNIPNRSQAWKAPVKEWVRELYRKKFGDREPKVPDRKG
jgi:hypothetical protein